MTSALARRLARLELAPTPGRMVYRVFSTDADAEADTEPALEAAVVRIITGVPRDTGRP